ncbi:MAG: aspartate aminotransferase family protein [Proteobacteria bacterium]|nr:aspartate aminotransferase family protein [Pseudomonadota bacterium]
MPPVMPTYNRADLAFERGEGAYLYATDGRRYLDFACGIAVTGLGHAHPHLVKALTDQAQKLWHNSNLFRIPGQEKLAKRLTEASFADTVFFGNSGAEAMECGIKVVRKYQAVNGKPERFRLVTFEGAFHGRTLATLAAGGQAKYLEGFGPKVEGFDQVPFGDLKAVKAAIGQATAGILIEPVQGEGGIRPVPPMFLRALRELCDEHGLLLFLDEIQTGMGRTGKLFAHEWSGVTPDVMAIAKAIGGGFPLGACLATAKAASGMTSGTHGSTYGGNPLAMAVGNAVLDVMLADGFLDRVQQSASHLRQQLAMLTERNGDIFEEVRGEGLLLGLKCRPPNTEVNAALRARGLLTAMAGDNVVRLLPPLIVEAAQISEATQIIDSACADLRKQAQRKVG